MVTLIMKNSNKKKLKLKNKFQPVQNRPSVQKFLYAILPLVQKCLRAILYVRANLTPTHMIVFVGILFK